MNNQVTFLGAGSWSTALAVLLAKKGVQVKMWARRKQQVQEITEIRENLRYLPGVVIPNNISLYDDPEEALHGSNVIISGVPSQVFRDTLLVAKPYLNPDSIIVNTAKGIEEASLLRLSQVATEVLPSAIAENYVILSGPSHAEEVAKDVPTTVVVSSKKKAMAHVVQDLFMAPKFRVYTNPDLIGVELGGALKNVIAVATGISDGLSFGDNTRAALMTRGAAEIARLGVAKGAKPLTFAGLSGIGDLIVTCTSMHSRNRRAGIEIGKGKSVEEAMDSVKMVVEGVRTTRAAFAMAKKFGVEMPITEQSYLVLFEGKNPKEAVVDLMMRSKTHELEEVAKLSSHWDIES